MLARMILCTAGTVAGLASAALAQPSPDWTACIATQQDPDAGIRACTAIINSGRERGRNLAIAHNNRGDGFWEKNDFDSALADYNRAIRIDKGYAIAYVNRGMVWRDKGDLDRAITDYTDAIRLNPRSAFAYNNRGLAWRFKGDLNRAIADYAEAIRLNPTYALAYQNRGNAWRDIGNLDRAVADYGGAIRLNPTNAALYGDRGYAQFYKGDFDRAVADYTEAIRLDPRYAPAYHHRGNAWRAKGDFDNAIDDYTAALRIDPDNSTIYGDRGYAHFYKGSFAGAVADFGRSIDLGENPYRMLFRFLAQARLGENGAAELAANAARLKSKDWPYPVIELLLGKQTAEGTLAAASKPSEKCEANFYVGEWHLIRRDREQAYKMLQTAVDSCSKTFYEHAAAITELQRINR